MCAGLLTICRKIWVKVLPHLCVDSPETETDDAEGGGNSGPKDPAGLFLESFARLEVWIHCPAFRYWLMPHLVYFYRVF